MQTLQEARRWVAWTYGPMRSNGKRTKIPRNPAGGNASTADPATWGTYDDAVQYAQRTGAAGIGLMLGSGIAGVDIDDCRDPQTGTLTPTAQTIIDMLDTYTEVSPSGTGIHAIMYVPDDWTWPRQRNDSIGLEIYSAKRYFTVTGQIIGRNPTVEDRGTQLTQVCRSYMPAPADASHTAANAPRIAQSAQTLPTAPTDDATLLERMYASRNGAEIRALYNGDTERYAKNRSRADMALCNQLAWWTGGNAVQMDRMFRASGLMRNKWDKMRGTQTYGERTIAAALASVRGGYQPKHTDMRPQREKSTVGCDSAAQPQSPGDATAAHPTVDDTPPDLIPPVASAKTLADKQTAAIERTASMQTRYRYPRWGMTIKDARKTIISTGIAPIDNMLDGGLYPGLIVLGGFTGTGKTTLVLQIADNIAAAGRPVLYVALEMSAHELMSKSIARYAASLATGTPLTYGQILAGYYDTSTWNGGAKYISDVKDRMYIHESIGNTSAAEVCEMARDVATATGTAPVIIVDYLQIMGRDDPRMTDKQAADANMLGLKQLSRDLDTPLILISGLNRDAAKNADGTITAQSFRDSSGIEYGADLLIGLEYDGNMWPDTSQQPIRLRVLKTRRGRKPDHPVRLMADLGTCAVTPNTNVRQHKAVY